MEGQSASTVLDASPELRAHLGVEYTDDYDFFESLQSIHDHKDPELWVVALNDFAAGWGLKP